MQKSKHHYLIPCMIFCSNEEYTVTTVLGSCVSVCFFDTVKHIGGINHYMLPFWNGKGLETPKYGNIAISKLYETMIDAGCRHKDLIAKVFGGGKITVHDNKNFQINIGTRNAEVAFAMLKELKIPNVASSIGNNYGRKILFNTQDGGIILKRIKKSSLNAKN